MTIGERVPLYVLEIFVLRTFRPEINFHCSKLRFSWFLELKSVDILLRLLLEYKRDEIMRKQNPEFRAPPIVWFIARDLYQIRYCCSKSGPSFKCFLISRVKSELGGKGLSSVETSAVCLSPEKPTEVSAFNRLLLSRKAYRSLSTSSLQKSLPVSASNRNFQRSSLQKSLPKSLHSIDLPKSQIETSRLLRSLFNRLSWSTSGHH